ncbi:MAG: lysine 5,6-aminomutase subunit alpha [Clostridia bacterium]|nr:lysine 5,6-aminomutase subunit alpha [Clostridia bacterium]MBN2882908.1 lysine 5,6-aminomutase subunit alpha [Clostridia bacterium]
MHNKLEIDKKTVASCRKNAGKIAKNIQKYISLHSTVAVERTVCRLFGVDGVDDIEVPYPNIVVDALAEYGILENGAADFFTRAYLHKGISAMETAKLISTYRFDFESLPMFTAREKAPYLAQQAESALAGIRVQKKQRNLFLEKYGDKQGPLLYVIVATGDIREDVTQAVAAANQGADVIAVIRTTGQSLLDYVPYGETHEGFGGTYATQENFKIMRSALDAAGEKLGKYIRLCNYCSGLCMPEIAAMGAVERLDMMLNDALYGILFRNINMKRTLVDQYFSRVINAFAGIIINTGEDNYLTTSDAYKEAHTVLASQFINEQFALLACLPKEQIGLGHAFEISPSLENSFVYELAQAQMIREIFPEAPLKYMPPTKHKTGDIFMANVQDALFNMVTILTGQKIHLLGMPTEAIHTPFMSDRAISLENAGYIFTAMKDLGAEISYKKDGIMSVRANEVLNKADSLIREIAEKGLFPSLGEGVFADIRRGEDEGRGLEGVFVKSKDYQNPFMDEMVSELKEQS